MGFASGFSNPAAEPPGSAGSARDAPGTWPSGVEPSAPPLPPNEVLNIDTEPMKLAEPGRFGYPSVDPWVATPTRVGSGRSSLDRPGAGPSALLTEPAAGPPISFDLNQNGALSGERKDAGGLLSKLLGLLGRGPKRAQGQKQQQQQQEQGYGQQQQQQYYGGGAGQSGRLHDVERGRRTMVQLRVRGVGTSAWPLSVSTELLPGVAAVHAGLVAKGSRPLAVPVLVPPLRPDCRVGTPCTLLVHGPWVTNHHTLPSLFPSCVET